MFPFFFFSPSSSLRQHSSKMPAQSANGTASSTPKPKNEGGVVESSSDDMFLFTSESVGEGHPGRQRTFWYLIAS